MLVGFSVQLHRKLLLYWLLNVTTAQARLCLPAIYPACLTFHPLQVVYKGRTTKAACQHHYSSSSLSTQDMFSYTTAGHKRHFDILTQLTAASTKLKDIIRVELHSYYLMCILTTWCLPPILSRSWSSDKEYEGSLISKVEWALLSGWWRHWHAVKEAPVKQNDKSYVA